VTQLQPTSSIMATATQDDRQSVKKGPSPLRSIIAGSTAGAIEIGRTLPLQVMARANESSDHIPSRMFVLRSLDLALA